MFSTRQSYHRKRNLKLLIGLLYLAGVVELNVVMYNPHQYQTRSKPAEYLLNKYTAVTAPCSPSPTATTTMDGSQEPQTNIMDWDEHDVHLFLSKLGFPQYEAQLHGEYDAKIMCSVY